MSQASDDIAIRVEHLGKRYRIGQRERYKTLRESMMGWLGRGAKRESAEPSSTEFWALDDVNFEVKRGEVVGIIGRNGAGKSTLLKVLSRITEPTRGRVEITGRVGSLLEVGTGFHPELTGRENVFLNGAILGMREGEIRQKFDEIVAFAEIEQFIDTPVKRYSSGMYTRLAFAVAAHLEPEILIVDEVLAVGDADFQKKCMGKMQDVADHGRTVLFVSHNMAAITRLCTRGVLLAAGRVQAIGSATEIATAYSTSDTSSPAMRTWARGQPGSGDAVARLISAQVTTPDGRPSTSHEIDRPIDIEVEYEQLVDDRRPTVSLQVLNLEGVVVLCSNDFVNRDWWDARRDAGVKRLRCRIPGNLLGEGGYNVQVALCSYDPNEQHVVEPNAIYFQIVDHTTGEGVRGPYAGPWPGIVRPMLQWDVTCR